MSPSGSMSDHSSTITSDDFEREESAVIERMAEAFRLASTSDRSDKLDDAQCDALAALFVPMLMELFEEEDGADADADLIDDATEPVTHLGEAAIMEVLDALNEEGSLNLSQDTLWRLQTHLLAKNAQTECARLATLKHNIASLPEAGQEVLVLKVIGGDEVYLEGTIKEVKGATAVVQYAGFHAEEHPLSDLVIVSSTSDEEAMTDGVCEMCMRSTRITRHHLIPRMTHATYRKKGFSRELLNTTAGICRPCHNMVHRVETNSTLAAKYNTIEKLLSHPKIQNWVEYASRQARLGK